MFKSIQQLCLCVMLSIGLTLPMAYAQGVKADSDLAVALNSMAKLQGFSCEFKQELTYAEGGKREYSGELAVSRPGKFSWRYIKPYEQLYISNGNGVWLYEPDLMQVQKLQDLGEVDPVVLQLLDGRIGLEDVFVLDKYLNQGVTIWQVRIGEEEQAVEVWLGIQDNQLYWIESRDVLSNANRLYLLNVKKDTPPDNVFEFIAPEGVDVVGE